jgi:hypothetical protein
MSNVMLKIDAMLRLGAIALLIIGYHSGSTKEGLIIPVGDNLGETYNNIGADGNNVA